MPTEQVNLTGLQDAWVEPDGTIHPLDRWGHENWAIDHGTKKHVLVNQGWVALSEGYWDDLVTQAQLDVIYDWYVANNQTFKAEWFKVV